MKNYSVEVTKTDKGTLYEYSDGYKQLVNLSTTLYDKDLEKVVSVTRARYLGRDIFLTYTHPNILGLLNMKTKKMDKIKVDEEDFANLYIKNKCLYNKDDEQLHRFDVRGIIGLDLNLRYINKDTPVKHTDLMVDKIWGVGSVSSFHI